MKKHFFKTLKAFLLVSILVLNSCSSDDDNGTTVTITANDINEALDENIVINTEIGTINATSDNTDTPITYTILSQTPEGAVSLNENKLVVADQSLFNYEINPQITGQIELAVGNTTETVNFTISLNNVEEPFVTTWRTNMADQEITIFTDSNFNYNYTVDWGDGEISNTVNGTISHDYDTSGIHTISITGTFPAILNGTDATKAARLQTIESWGDIAWESMDNAFSRCTNLTSNALDTPNLSGVNDMSGMFFQAALFNGDIGVWDVSNITDMRSMFLEATAFNQDINDWDVSNVVDLNSMFREASSFNQDLNNWDITSANSIAFIFELATSFNGAISNWDVSNITNMSGLFADAASFNQDLSGWDVGNVNSMSELFYNATSFNQDISSWDVSNVTDMSNMFEEATSFNQDLSGWNTENVTSCSDFSIDSALIQAHLPVIGTCDF